MAMPVPGFSVIAHMTPRTMPGFANEMSHSAGSRVSRFAVTPSAETDKFADQSRASTVDATGVELVERGAYSVVMRF